MHSKIQLQVRDIQLTILQLTTRKHILKVDIKMYKRNENIY